MKKLNSFDFKKRGRYDWDKMLDGTIWQMTQGEDFDCTVQTFRGAVYQAARRANKTVNVKVDSDTVTFQAHSQDPKNPSEKTTTPVKKATKKTARKLTKKKGGKK